MKYKDIKFKTHFFLSQIGDNKYLVAKCIIDNEEKLIYISYQVEAIGPASKDPNEKIVDKTPRLYISDFLSVMGDDDVIDSLAYTKKYDDIIALTKK